ncbi:uncharacterized protein V1516DRAFT_708061 [Lipomyces oligophaga]|uniref:uncharacterized protein n=1 Tax=Lipomyces oligophaga TaxID=45792 RepID=UPI0034CF7858
MPNPYIPLECNPEVLSSLSHSLGISKQLSFHDVYSIDDPELLSFIPRPVYALLLVFPVSESYETHRIVADSDVTEYSASPEDTILWLKQTIPNACGTMALLHSLLNIPQQDKYVIEGSLISDFHKDLPHLSVAERIKYIESSESLSSLHDAAARSGDTSTPDALDDVDLHYVTLVKSQSGDLWELDGRRKGPIFLTALGPDLDVLSPASIKFVKEFIDRESSNISFSLVALAPSSD